MHSLGKFCVPYCQKKAFPNMGVLTKYDHIERIYLPQAAVAYIYLHPVFAKVLCPKTSIYANQKTETTDGRICYCIVISRCA
jgi:hypothetical protein